MVLAFFAAALLLASSFVPWIRTHGFSIKEVMVDSGGWGWSLAGASIVPLLAAILALLVAARGRLMPGIALVALGLQAALYNVIGLLSHLLRETDDALGPAVWMKVAAGILLVSAGALAVSERGRASGPVSVDGQPNRTTSGQGGDQESIKKAEGPS